MKTTESTKMDFDEKMNEVEDATKQVESSLEALHNAACVENETDLEANLADAVEALNDALKTIRAIRK